MTNEVAQKDVADIIKSELGEEAEEIMPSLGRKIYNEGREEGALQKAVETCKAALLKGFDLQTIVQLTGLPLNKVLEIQKSINN